MRKPIVGLDQFVDLTPKTKDRIAEFQAYMRQRRYSENSVRMYTDVLSKFLRYEDHQYLDVLSAVEIINFNKTYILPNNFSKAYQNQVINSVKLYAQLMGMGTIDLYQIERPRKHKHLPVILSQEEVERLLNRTKNVKHRCMLTLIYSMGLRSNELRSLKISDIDSDRMIVHIKSAKGNKDRVVPLAPSALNLMREYYKQHRPKEYLFNGQESCQYSKSSLAKVMKMAVKRAGIKKRCSLHTLRHSFATHLLEQGINLRYIQELLGHQSSKTTEIYTRVTMNDVRNIESPLEKLNLK